jgi:hypothetical protein
MQEEGGSLLLSEREPLYKLEQENARLRKMIVDPMR